MTPEDATLSASAIAVGRSTPERPTALARSTHLRQLFPALNHSRFRVFWLGMSPSMFAIQMGTVATGYAAFTLSGSATVLGGISLAQGIPMLLLSLVGGVVADRTSR